jgi:hypothetical protein
MPTLGIEIECIGANLNQAHLGASGSIPSGASVRFIGCVIYEYGGGPTLWECTPTNGGTESGVIETNEVHGELKLSLGSGVVEITPDWSEPLAYVEVPEECAFGPTIPVEGELVLRDCEEAINVSQKAHFVEEGLSSELWVFSKENPVTIDGSANIWLTGSPNWNGLPG